MAISKIGGNGFSSDLVINDGSVDSDFRVESDGDANCFFVDGAENEVAIGTNTPSGHSSPNGALFVINSSTPVRKTIEVLEIAKKRLLKYFCGKRKTNEIAYP